jgi:ribonucleoside-diphosphate reductase subunit M2
MESPVKKLDFSASNKENAPFDADLATLEAEIDANHQKSIMESTKESEKPAVVPEAKSDVADEPLLQENPQRFVLFPIKYHEVRVDASGRVKWNAC